MKKVCRVSNNLGCFPFDHFGINIRKQDLATPSDFAGCVKYTGKSGFVSYSENTEPSYNFERQNSFNQTSVHHIRNTLTNAEVFQLSKKEKTLLRFLKYKINMLSEGQLLINNSTKILETVNNFHFLPI